MYNLKISIATLLLLIFSLRGVSEDSHKTEPEAEHEDHTGHDHAEGEHDEEGEKHEKEDDHEDHTGNDHENEKADKDDDHEDHTGHDHDAKDAGYKEDDDEHEGEGEEGVIELTAEQKKDIGLKTKTAAPGNLHKELTLTGEVVLNEDNVIHLVPRVSGIATKVYATLGDMVKKGDPLVTLDSAELGEAKSDYYEKFNQINCCSIELDRAATIEKNTKHLLSVLKKIPSLDELRKKEYGDMGEYRSKLVASYADFLTNKINFERQKGLHDKEVISKKAFEDERNKFEKVKAIFFSKVHSARFKIMQTLFEAEREQRVNEFKLKTAERKLRLLGLPKKNIDELQILTKQEKIVDITKPKKECTGPNCTDCAKDKKKDVEDDFSKITIIAPESGRIIKRHIARGEKVSTEEEIFTIADLTTVWIILQIPARDISLVKKDTKVIIESPYGLKSTGKIKIIAPTLNESTRTAKALIVLDNPREEWKPGSFITGHILLNANNLNLVIPKQAVQNIEGKDVVFIVDGHGFKAVPIVIGRSDRTQVEVISGLKKGMKYVTNGAFELKAIMITSNMDSHAGHGH